MTDLPTLKSLQTRIREAKGASRELDVEISCALLAPEGCYVRVLNGMARVYQQDGRMWWPDFNFDLSRSLFTTDPDGLGACVALMRETLPGALWSVWDMEDGPGCRLLCPGKSGAYHDGFWSETDPVLWTPPTVCAAFLDAICAAMIAQMEAREGVK